MTYMDKIHTLINACRDMFCLDHWEIRVRTLAQEFMTENADGYCSLDHKYLTASIDVAEGLGDKRLTHVVIHEMTHLLLSPLEGASNFALDAVPERKRKPEGERIEWAVEQVCQHLARGLSRLDAVGALLEEGENNGDV